MAKPNHSPPKDHHLVGSRRKTHKEKLPYGANSPNRSGFPHSEPQFPSNGSSPIAASAPRIGDEEQVPRNQTPSPQPAAPQIDQQPDRSGSNSPGPETGARTPNRGIGEREREEEEEASGGSGLTRRRRDAGDSARPPIRLGFDA